MNQKIENPKVEVPETIEMNDRDYINDILETEKNMSDNLSIALNEASNNTLYEEILMLFIEIKNSQRELYNMMFKKGWYSLEKAEENKVTQKCNELSQKLNQLI
ncbi:MAG: spore coat protein [Bacilli bacterium]|nr:spore coat protein [Bacilli bacterium]